MSESLFGEKLKSLRLDSRVGLRELARVVDKSPGYLSDVKNGKVPPPSDGVILDLAKPLHVDKRDLLSAARKIDPEISDYVSRQPKAADFLRLARERIYDDEDWERLARLAEIAKLGKEEKEKK
jgi:transcriptional regulator with XRE-family HTH domain